MQSKSNDYDVLVIGAGAAGLAAGRRLQQRGARVLIVEARNRVGGRAWTVHTPLGPIDLGCAWLHSAETNPWTQIACELNVEVNRATKDLYQSALEGRLSPADQQSWQLAYGAFRSRLDAVPEDAPDRPVTDLLEPSNRWNSLIVALGSLSDGADYSDLSVHDMRRYQESGTNWQLPQGYGSLIAGYRGTLPIRLDTVATLVDTSGPSVLATTSGGTIRAANVIVTLPVPLLANGSLQFVPSLSASKIEAFSGIPLAVTNKTFFEVHGEVDLPVDSLSIGSTDRVGTGRYYIRPLGRPIIAGYYGGSFALELERLGKTAMFDFACDELAGLFGSTIRNHLKPLEATAWASDPFSRGSYSYARPGHSAQRAVLAETIEGRVLFAGEACSPRAFSTAHGAFDTGVNAANEILF